MGNIYCILNVKNGKRYIGQTTLTLQERFKQHVKAALSNTGYYLHSAMRKYGVDNFTIELLEECEEELLHSREIYWVSHFKSFGEMGYNLTEGGEGARGFHHSESTRVKMKEHHWSKTGSYTPNRKVLSDDSRQRISEALIAYYKTHSHPATGRSLSEAAKLKISVANSGKTRHPDAVAKSANGNRGKIRTDEARHRYSLSKSGTNNPMSGTAAPNRRVVLQFTIHNEFVAQFSSLKDAWLATGACTSSIRECCKGNYGTAGGFVWYYFTDPLLPKSAPTLSRKE